MDEKQEIRELIIRLKEARAKKHLSYQNIVEGCEQNGTPVGKTSVARIFSDGSENMSFRYETTLKPVAQFLLGVDDPLAPPEPEPAPLEPDEILHEIQRQRDQEVCELTERYDRRLSEKDAEIQRLRAGSRYRTIAIIVLGTLLIMFMAIAIGYLAWDLSHPTQGAFQWETATFLH